MFRSIRGKLVLIYLLLILFAMQLIGVYFIRSVNSYFLGNFSTTINTQARFLSAQLQRYMEKDMTPETIKDIDNLITSFASESEVYVLNKNGTILATSGDKSTIGQKRLRTEVTRALLGSKDEVIREDAQSGQRYTFLAIPIKNETEVIGAVYMVAPMSKIYKTIKELNMMFYTGLLIALVLTAILGVALARTITNPIVEITKKAKAMARGDFNQVVQVRNDDEIGQLGETFNYLVYRLKGALDENEQEREKLEAILTHLSDGVIAVDSSNQIVLINPAAKQLLGCEDDPVGLPITQLLMMEEDPNTPLPLMAGREMHFRGPKGSILQAYASPIRGEKGTTRFVIVIRDITEKEREEQARRDFVANVSHEIRTPLTTIKSYLEALNDGAAEEPVLRTRFLQVIQNETERMVRMVTELLQLSRLDAGKMQWTFQNINLVQILDDVADRFAFQCRQQEISMFVEAPSTLPLVAADPDKLDQVLDNLVTNAIKHTPAQGIIRLVATAKQELIEVKVIDSGIGIPAKDLPRIFERFYRVDKARSRKLGGTGLGLSIAKQIIEAHGGSIWIESVVDKGTTVTFTLPRVKEGAA
ncbi:ATP-binding protein [Effusibacillus lacus]|uniref:histidine kinase n=1 Tax=Effusibacillus lacus TaxID=1348429 RepID=A0A292YKW5_9BACL|nr:ATP-binding protein [Effusibacillus lacus]TCS75150.1 two-component system sensor histidine kinase VicK [Effusibacillus lacus]GAX89100.1 PAS domain-containing sensor histidine kinase [Effusibacillus lacus]